LQQLFGCRSIALGDSDAGTDIQGRSAGSDDERCGEDIEESFRDNVNAGLERHTFGQDDEFIPAESPDGVGLSDGTQESNTNAHEELVTGAVTECVIDVLEVVEIEEERGNRVMLASRSRQHSVDSVQDQRSIRKTRE
jgi:hypothetical protein